MQKVICDSYEQMSKKAAQMIADAVKEKPELILGLPTGGTPVGMYAEISRMVQEKQADFSNVTTFNLDEYIGLPKDHEQSYYYFMNDNLYSKVPLKEGNVPNGMSENTTIFFMVSLNICYVLYFLQLWHQNKFSNLNLSIDAENALRLSIQT